MHFGQVVVQDGTFVVQVPGKGAQGAGKHGILSACLDAQMALLARIPVTRRDMY